MAVYVDQMGACAPTRNWRWLESCHLFADTEEELHAFAARLGLARAFFVWDLALPRYNLTAWKRGRAVEMGAVPVDRAFVQKFMRKRTDGAGVVDAAPVEAPSVKGNGGGGGGGLFGSGGRML